LARLCRVICEESISGPATPVERDGQPGRAPIRIHRLHRKQRPTRPLKQKYYFSGGPDFASIYGGQHNPRPPYKLAGHGAYTAAP
jgi:hypothetical protein